jgi:hypothetical protein
MRRLAAFVCLTLTVLLWHPTQGWSADFQKGKNLPSCPGSYNKNTWNNCAGTTTYADGSQYFGEWKNGKYYGQGIKTYTDGRIEEGKWENNKFLGPTMAFLEASCDTEINEDVFMGLSFETSQPINAKDYGCAFVKNVDGFPVFDGTQSARFEVRASDCSTNTNWDDCPNDRSRHEINETDRESSEGRLLAYELMVYIPSKPQVRPLGRNLLFLVQLNVRNSSLYTTLAYLEVSEWKELLIRTHKGFTWDIKRQYMVLDNPLDKWTKVRFEVKSTSDDNGYLKVFVNDEIKVHETRQTLPTLDSKHSLKFGIYNAYKSKATEPYGTQIVYFDAISKSAK